jgi:hypothetical protein
VRYLPAQPLIEAVSRALQHAGTGLAPLPARDIAVLAAWAAESSGSKANGKPCVTL